MQVGRHPYVRSLLRQYDDVMSQHGGIVEGTLITGSETPNDPFIPTVTGNMPNYNRLLIDPEHEMEFHLSGYGTNYDEAVIKLIGESIERYALLEPGVLYEDEVRYASHRELTDAGEDVVPFEYIHYYDDGEYEALRQLSSGNAQLHEPTRDSVFGWLECDSLFEPDRSVWMPAQALLQGYMPNLEEGERRMMQCFSTGTASHVSVKQALHGALVEAIEVDSLMVHWYADRSSPLVTIEDETLSDLCSSVLGPESDFEVMPVYTTLPDLPVHTVGVFLVRERPEMPYIVYGGETGLDPKSTVYRGIMESTAIITLGRYGHLYMPASYLLDPDETAFANLDSNVSYYADPENGDEKLALIERLIDRENAIPYASLENPTDGSVDAELEFMLDHLSDVSEYGVYLDLTPPELAHTDFRVVRTYIPELVTLCLPGFPYSGHPRMEAYGGVQNEHPHPLP